MIGLKKELSNTKLEFEYLSSAEKLLEHHSMYFEEDLKDINEIKILKKSEDIQIKDLILIEKMIKNLNITLRIKKVNFCIKRINQILIFPLIELVLFFVFFLISIIYSFNPSWFKE